MNFFKKWIFGGFVSSITGVIVGYILSRSYDFGICYINEAENIFSPSCRQTMSLWSDALFYPSLALALIFLILLFMPQAVRAWRKFSVWYIPIAILWLASYRESFSAWDFSDGLQGRAMSVSSIYIGVSVGIIVVALVSQWRQKKKGTPALRWWWYWLGALVSLLLFSGIYRGIMDLTLSGLNAIF
jgi:hypothetical protein